MSVGVSLAAVNNLKYFCRHTHWQPWDSDVPVLFPGLLYLFLLLSLCGSVAEKSALETFLPRILPPGLTKPLLMVIAQCSLEQFQGCPVLCLSYQITSLCPSSSSLSLFTVLRVSQAGCIQCTRAVKSWWHREKSVSMQLHNCLSHMTMTTTKLSFDFFFLQMYHSVLKTSLQCRHYYPSHFTDEEVSRSISFSYLSFQRGTAGSFTWAQLSP